ncbi:hypothetical protein MLD38_020382 [Melastoma candidum]|uniref:Uncharacterized protein n=1 Tax=Melastoma candidum TaxID=119954 RepID=A0ACB9QFR5_9MYRT|nr:hypothetical protein MLD38_020382 [Melastoma candidum]
MWQFLLAAAVAGSTGFVANHLLHQPTPTNNPFGADRPTSQEDSSAHHLPPPGDEVFRFSSSGSGEKLSKKGKKKKKQKKKKDKEKKTEEEGEEESAQKKEFGRGGLGDERKKVGRGRRRVHVCLKRRKTGKNCEKRPQCGSCLSKDGSSFNWGLGLGLMYMMSAEKSEIRKLNTAVDETAKVVKELKTELYSRKLSQFFSGEETKVLDVTSSKKSQKTVRNVDDGKVSGQIASHEGECASSVLTEELQDFKMTELEAELESELQKLPWSMGEASSTDEYNIIKMGTGASGERLHEQADESLGLHYSNGVSPHLLKQKLSHVLIEQQENHIVELESELHVTRSKLNEKEAELRALKDCVRRLSNISLSAVSEEDIDARLGDLGEEEEDDDVVGSESSKSPGVVVGMKRPNLQL